MMKKFQRLVSAKLILIVLAFSATAFVAESCGQKHACGSKHQKRVRNRRIKSNTNFMTY